MVASLQSPAAVVAPKVFIQVWKICLSVAAPMLAVARSRSSTRVKLNLARISGVVTTSDRLMLVPLTGHAAGGGTGVTKGGRGSPGVPIGSGTSPGGGSG